jgi:adenine-specific DNA-methyltransferase
MVGSLECARETEPVAEFGQVWTPTFLANKMVQIAQKALGRRIESIIDPAVGPATFIKALSETNVLTKGVYIQGFDIDHRMVGLSTAYLQQQKLTGKILLEDYLQAGVQEKADVVLMNPPYIRQEDIPSSKKLVYKEVLFKRLGIEVSGRSNLYVYFLLKALTDLKVGGILCAIVYDGLKNTRYGQETLKIISTHADILYTENVSTPFQKTMVDATIFLAKRREHPRYAHNLEKDEPRVPEGFTRLSNLLETRRGLGLINAKVFMTKPNDPFANMGKVFVKKQALLSGNIVQKEHPERAYLFSAEDKVPSKFIKWLLEKAQLFIHSSDATGVKDLQKKITGDSKNWFHHSSLTAPILFNYYLRGEPRHIFNPHHHPAADNFYLSTPVNVSVEAAWLLLNTKMYREGLLAAARNQGSGLSKLQLYEYKEAILPDWRVMSKKSLTTIIELGKNSIANETRWSENLKYAEEILVREYASV